MSSVLYTLQLGFYSFMRAKYLLLHLEEQKEICTLGYDKDLHCSPDMSSCTHTCTLIFKVRVGSWIQRNQWLDQIL